MNFKTYNAQNAPHKVAPKQNKRFSVSMRSGGLFILSRTLHEAMGNPGGIVILQDTQYPADFYIRASGEPQAFKLSPGAHNQVTFRSNTMAGVIAETLHLTPPYRVKFPVALKEDGLYCICTKQAVIKKI